MNYRNLAILATGLLYSCNVSDTPTSSTEHGVSIAPRLMLAQGTSLPVTDSVHIKVWSSSPANVWYEKSLPWSSKFVVISGVPQGTSFLFAIEGRKLQSDSTSAIWWSGNQSGTTNSAQSLDPVDVPVWISIGDTVAPTISGLKDTILDSAVAGVRLRWTVTDSSLASVWLGANKLTLTGNVATDTVSVSVGGSTSLTVKAFDNAGNLSTKKVTIARKAIGNGILSKDSVLPRDANTIGLWNFNEGSGASITNAVTGLAGSLTGGYSWVDGYFGKAVQFDGVSGYANLNFDPPETNATFEMIVKIQRDTGWLFTLWGGNNSGLALSSTGVTIPYFTGESNNIKWDTTRTLYIATTVNSTHLANAYINGILVDSGTAADPYSWSSSILASYTGTAGYVKCSIEKVRFSSVVRSGSEINSISQKIGLSKSLLK